MGRSNEYDRAFARDVECTARPYFTEEDVGDHPPKHEGGVVDEVRPGVVRLHSSHNGERSREIVKERKRAWPQSEEAEGE